MDRIIHTLRKGLPKGLEELAQLGRTLWRRRKDVLVYFDIGASNGPVEAINGRLEDLTPVWWTPDIQPSRAGRKVIYHHVQVLRTVQTRCRGPLRKQ